MPAIRASLACGLLLASAASGFSPASPSGLRARTRASAASATRVPMTASTATRSRLSQRLTQCKENNKAAFIGYITGGYPTPADTVPLLKGMEAGGCDVIELGVPFTDPQADGATIQEANKQALAQGTSLPQVVEMVKQARAEGVTAPIMLMGYWNPFLQYGLDKLMADCSAAGVDGFIVVDLPPEEGKEFIEKCAGSGLGFVPLVAPTSTDERIAYLADAARKTDAFTYCVSVNGVTGARGALPTELKDLVGRVKAAAGADVPVAVGFGIKDKSQVSEVASLADAVVVGSAIVHAAEAGAAAGDAAAGAQAFTEGLAPGTAKTHDATSTAPDPDRAAVKSRATSSMPDNWGGYGGRYIPETLEFAHVELEAAYDAIKNDPAYLAELAEYRKHFIGGPTPMWHAKRLSEQIGGAQIWIKREELAHTGAHKINNAVGQALIAQRLGKKRIIAETGAGQHGVATATVCALLGLECVIYMGAVDCARQSLNVFRMNMLGAKVVPVRSGQATLKDAINEAMRDWVTNPETTHYLIGSAIGPHPFPTIVRDLQSVIGREARAQILEQAGKLPDIVAACVGGGSNAIGMFHPFRDDKDVEIVGVEADGQSGAGMGSATLTRGRPGVLHGTKTYLLQEDDGQVTATHSISAGLDYPGVGPEHAFLKDSGRATYVAVNDAEALDAFSRLSRTEGIVPALEPSHVVAYAMKVAAEMDKDQIVLINLSGRGDKDMLTVAKALNCNLDDYTPTDSKMDDFMDRISQGTK